MRRVAALAGITNLVPFDETVSAMYEVGIALPSELRETSLGGLAANLTLQVWQRAHALHSAALARNNDGPLRFLEPTFAHSRRDCRIAGLAGASLIALAMSLA